MGPCRAYQVVGEAGLDPTFSSDRTERTSVTHVMIPPRDPQRFCLSDSFTCLHLFSGCQAPTSDQ